MRRTILGVVLISVLTVAGCGSSTQAPGQGDPSNRLRASVPAVADPVAASQPVQDVAGATFAIQDSCKLITQAEASTALGKATDAGVSVSPDIRNCIWSATDVTFNSVELSITSLGAFNSTDKAGPGFTVKQVSGLGDGAYFLEVGAEVILNVKKGSQAFDVTVFRVEASVSDLERIEQTLAQAVVGRI